MKTVDQIMELADDYAASIAQQGEAHDHIARDALKSAIEELVKDAAQSKPNCTECRKWEKQQADNREWIEGVKRGKEIVERLAVMKGQTP